MTVTTGTVWRPTAGLSGTVVVRTVTDSKALVAPWPSRGRSRVQLRPVQLTADRSGLVGFVATGQRG